MTVQYGIYITPGSGYYNPNYEWGGWHITMAGFHENNGNFDHAQAAVARIASDCNWSLPEYTIEKWNDKWTIVFKSKTLTSISKELKKSDFQKVKEPKFHITLYKVKSKSQAMQVAKKLAKKDRNWHLTLVEQNDQSNPKWTWEQYAILKKV